MSDPKPEQVAPRYRCAECGEGITTADDLITVSVSGHAKPAHRECSGKSEQVRCLCGFTHSNERLVRTHAMLRSHAVVPIIRGAEDSEIDGVTHPCRGCGPTCGNCL